MKCVDPDRCQPHRTTRIPATDDAGSGPFDSGDLLRAYLLRKFGLGHLVAPASTTTAAVIVELNGIRVRREDHSDGQVSALYMAKVARVLNRNRLLEPPSRRRQSLETFAEPFTDIAYACAEGQRFGRSEQVAIVLERSAASGGIDDDRCIAGERAHDPVGKHLRIRRQSGMCV